MRLSAGEAASLTVASWADRYPPLARSRTGSPPRPIDDWAFSTSHRYCPDCLAGDGSPVQQQYGGPWQKAWHLPVTFACPRHQRFLREGCPQPHPGSQAVWRPPAWLLIAFPSAAGLHPAQCRRPLGIGGHRSACGTRLDEPGEDHPHPSQGIIEAQQALLAMLSPQHPAEDAARTFTDLRVVSALLCRSWPLGQDLMDSPLATAVSEHIRHLNTGYHLALDRQPDSNLATAGLLTAAIAIRDSADLQGTLAHHVQPSTGIPVQAWTRILARHQSACTPALREAAMPLADRTKRADSTQNSLLQGCSPGAAR
jgi:hypothetical protein